MNSIFHDMTDISVVAYLDDILIYSPNMDDHRRDICQVLECLRQHNLYAKPEKCSFHKDTVEYLGYIVSPKGISMDPAKVAVIAAWLLPTNLNNVHSFLGFSNFY